MEKVSLALIWWAEPLLGFGVLTCWRSWVLIIPDLHPGVSTFVLERFLSIKQLSFQNVHHTQMLITLKFKYNKQRVCVCDNPFTWVHIVFLPISSWKAWRAVSTGRMQGLSPCGHSLDERWEEPALHFYFQRAKPVPPITWLIPAWRWGRMSLWCRAAPPAMNNFPPLRSFT